MLECARDWVCQESSKRKEWKKKCNDNKIEYMTEKGRGKGFGKDEMQKKGMMSIYTMDR